MYVILRIAQTQNMAIWTSGNTLATTNIVALRQTRLVSRRVTICGRQTGKPSQYYYQPARSTQPSTSVG